MSKMLTFKSYSGFRLALATLCAGAFASFGLLVPAPTARAQPATVTGLWIDHTGRGAVEITQCGGSLCGHIAWLKDPNRPDGKPQVDAKGRPICGLQIIGDMKKMSETLWDNGWIFDPERDDRFSVELRLKSSDQLQVLGYAGGMKFLGETYVWRRAPASQARCAKRS